MKKVLGVLGIGIIAGTIVYIFLDKRRKDNARATQKEVQNSDSVTEPVYVKKDDQFNDIKNTAINEMVTRHEKAAKVMKDAVDIICKRSEVYEDESGELEHISNELDELLKEE